MTKLNVEYSLDFEVERVASTLKEIEWFKKNKYFLNLPEKFTDEIDVKKITKEDIYTAIKSEFDEKVYEEAKEHILSEWNDSMIDGDELAKLDVTPLNECRIFLTRYGVGGSYHFPNEIIINFQQKYSFGRIRTIAHEITHLLIQTYISKYKVSHWRKERIVDLLMTKLSSKLYKEQN
ncbi:MAG: hypothetical protein WC629_01945, partial [Candidatus Paceibacterota bacterium]